MAPTTLPPAERPRVTPPWPRSPSCRTRNPHNVRGMRGPPYAPDVQLVIRAVEALLTSGQNKSGGGGGNVLCYGYRRKRPAGTAEMAVPRLPLSALLPYLLCRLLFAGSLLCCHCCCRHCLFAACRWRPQRAWHGHCRIVPPQQHHRQPLQPCLAGDIFSGAKQPGTIPPAFAMHASNLQCFAVELAA